MSESEAPRVEWLDDREFRIGDVRFSCISVSDRVNPTEPDHFVLIKPRDAIERYVEQLAGPEIRTLLELGIYRGGSTVFFERLLRPDRIVALDLKPGPCMPLEGFINRHELRSRFSIHYSTDQADREALAAILASTGLTGSLDLVIDDASHRYDATRQSLTVLFPHLRPGGRYVIEDWAWGQSGAQFVVPEALRATPALGVLLFECVSINAARPDVISEITIGPGFATLTRGPAELDPETFTLEAFRLGRSGELVDRLLAAWPPEPPGTPDEPPSPAP